MSFLRGQVYDGAGAMAGRAKGVAARIQNQYPKAIYTHCAAHHLNLCIVKCCSIQEKLAILWMLQIVLKDSKCQQYFEECIDAEFKLS